MRAMIGVEKGGGGGGGGGMVGDNGCVSVVVVVRLASSVVGTEPGTGGWGVSIWVLGELESGKRERWRIVGRGEREEGFYARCEQRSALRLGTLKSYHLEKEMNETKFLYKKISILRSA